MFPTFRSLSRTFFRGSEKNFIQKHVATSSNNWHQRSILEAWEINCAKDPLNQGDGPLLPNEYLHLTLAYKKK